MRGEPDAIADWIILVEGYDSAEIAATRSELAAGLLANGAEHSIVTGLYTLDFTLGQDEAKQIWLRSQH